MSRTSLAPPRVTVDNIGFLLAKASQRFNERLHERFEERGFGEVRASYGSVLVPLFERDGLRLVELAAAARLSKQSMTALVKLCEVDGLVERQRDPDDGRAFNVRLTPRGHEFRSVAEEVLAELDEELVETIGNHNRDALIEALKEVIEL